MKRKRQNRAVVVDASVAKPCSVKERGRAALSIACTDALVAIKDAGLHVAMCEALDEEWRRHASTFARKWLVQMFSRKRVVRVTKLPAHPALRHAIAKLEEEAIANDRLDAEAIANAIRKDFHLVELALATDRRVVSLDDRMRLHLGNLTTLVRGLRAIHWANPLGDGCVAWLRNGAPDEPTFLLVPQR